jgi:hypothetical protein
MRTLLVGLCVSLAVGVAEAKPKRELRNTFGYSANLIGLQDEVLMTWRWSTTESKNPLVQDAHVMVGAVDLVSPAFNRVGLWAEYSPLSIIDFRVGIEQSSYFGTFSTLIGFDDYSSPYDPDSVLERQEERRPGWGGRIYFEPTIKLKVGSVIFAAFSDLEYWKLIKKPEGGDFFYESARDTLLRSDGDVMMTTSAVLLQEAKFNAGRSLVAGFAYDRLDVFAAPENQRQTLGLLGVATLGEKLGQGALRKPTLITKVFYYVKDRPDLEKVDEVGAQIAFRFFVGGD